MDSQILSKYRNGWTAGKPSCSFTFGEDGLEGKLKKESGNGWQATISGSSEVSSESMSQLASTQFEFICFATSICMSTHMLALSLIHAHLVASLVYTVETY